MDIREKFIDSLLNNLTLCKKSDYIKLEKTIMNLADEFFPKNSKSLGQNLSKKALTASNDLDLILVGHLYIERLLNDLLDHVLKGFKSLEKTIFSSFYKKAIYVKYEKLVSVKSVDDILVFNQLRNKFAHNLNYDLADFDVFKFSYAKPYADKIKPKRKNDKRVCNRLIIRASLLYFLFNLTKENEVLFLSDL